MDSEQPVVVIVPMDVEFAPYRTLLTELRPVPDGGPWEMYQARAGEQPVALVLSDCGPANAAAAAERMISQWRPAAVLHGGSAGAHNPELLPGDLVIGARYLIHTTRADRAARIARGVPTEMIRFRQGGRRVKLEHLDGGPALVQRAAALANGALATLGTWPAAGWPEDAPRRPGRAITGVIASADLWTADPEDIRALREDFGADCEDMESAYVAQICALHGVPFLAVRAISNNDARQAIAPPDIMAAIAAAGERAARLIVALAVAIGAGESEHRA